MESADRHQNITTCEELITISTHSAEPQVNAVLEVSSTESNTVTYVIDPLLNVVRCSNDKLLVKQREIAFEGSK